MQRNPPHFAIALVAWLVLTVIAAAAGAFASRDAAAFYLSLTKPEWAPPASIFGPVWTILYLLMGISAWLVWQGDQGPVRRAALALYAAQLVVNALWSWLFFGWHLGAAAFADVLLLLALVLACLVTFWQVSRPAGVLLLPYVVWVAFASCLTWAVWRSNPALL